MPELYHLLNMISKGEKAAALRELAGILRADPQNLEAWLLMAHALDDQRRKVDCYQQALRLDPAHEFAKRQLEALTRPTGVGQATAAAPAGAVPPAVEPARPATKLCPYCQQENPLNALTCWACGGRLLHSSLSQHGGLAGVPLQSSAEPLGWRPTEAFLTAGPIPSAEASVTAGMDSQPEAPESGELAWLPAMAQMPIEGQTSTDPSKTGRPAMTSPSAGQTEAPAKPVAPPLSGAPRPTAPGRLPKAPAGQPESFLESIYIVEIMVYALLAILFWALMAFVGSPDADLLKVLGGSFVLFFCFYLLYLPALAIWSGMAGLFKIIAVIGFGGMPLFVLIPGDLIRRLAFAFYGGRKAVRVAFGSSLKKSPR